MFRIKSHNPCFSRILFAIKNVLSTVIPLLSHNPCFSRILFAILTVQIEAIHDYESQSLF